jgi:thiol-disulfide isomerase/thioredoxin
MNSFTRIPNLNMKKFLLLASLLLTLQSAHAVDEIHFEHDAAWADVLSKASSQQKLVFVDAYTTWCGPCKWMAKTAFVDPSVAEFFNSHFINAKIDMEAGEGPALAKQYEVNAYPTLLFVDGSGALVHSAVGARTAADLLQLAQDVINGNFVSLPAMKARFEGGDHDRKFLKEYIMTLANVAGDFQAPMEVYKAGMKGDALLEDDNWQVFRALFGRKDSEYATYFLSHRAAFEAKFGQKEVQEKALNFYFNGAYTAALAKDAATYDDLRKELSHSGIARMDSVLPALDMLWTQVGEDWKGYAKAAKAYLAQLDQPAPEVLNDIAWTFYEHVDAKADMNKALEWINASVAAQPEYANLDTQAMVLMKLGRTDEAIAAAKQAIEAGKAAGEDVAQTEEALQEMLGN